jgi:two-component system alkaline phosphatase synthesis response regulator PhoP
MEQKRILIADDEEDYVTALEIALEAEGYECLTASDGQEALDKAKGEKPDLIILDIMMPKMNGYKVSRLLKFDLKYKDIPIIMLTARAQEKDKCIGKETGADEYVTKPFEMEEMIQLVDKHLRKGESKEKKDANFHLQSQR